MSLKCVELRLHFILFLRQFIELFNDCAECLVLEPAIFAKLDLGSATLSQ